MHCLKCEGSESTSFIRDVQRYKCKECLFTPNRHLKAASLLHSHQKAIHRIKKAFMNLMGAIFLIIFAH